MSSCIETKSKLLDTFKSLLEEESVGSQGELAVEMSKRGFDNLSQSSISRLLIKLGAIKIKNTYDRIVYKLPEAHLIPNKKQSINSVVLNVQHNGVQIVVKTIVGGGSIISKIIESMSNRMEILGCIASNDTVLVIPSHVNNIEHTTQQIITHFKMNTDYAIR